MYTLHTLFIRSRFCNDFAYNAPTDYRRPCFGITTASASARDYYAERRPVCAYMRVCVCVCVKI